MRDEMKQLDELEMSDLWPTASARVPGPDFDPGASRSTSSRAVAGVVALLVAGGAFAFLWTAFTPTDPIPSGPDPSAETLLEAEGTSFILPDGWQGAADSLPGYTHRIYRVATFPLPPLDDIAATDARALIGPDDTLIVMNEFTVLCPPCAAESSGLPLVLGPDDLQNATQVPRWVGPTLADIPDDHALARRVFKFGYRYFDLSVEFGSVPVSKGAFDRVNTVLGSLAIGEWVPERNGTCQWGELGMLDPDCPQPHWLTEVLAVAGFRIGDEGGSFVARSDGTEFFIGVEELTEVSPEQLAALEDRTIFPIVRSVQGIEVYGHAQGWEWSTNEMHVYIEEGPFGDSKLPDIRQLTPLVEASVKIPYPPAE